MSHNEEERENLIVKEPSLNKQATAFCALKIIRHKEKHGDYPSNKQKFHLIDISKQRVILEKELKKQGFDSNQGGFIQEEMSERIQYTLMEGGILKDNPIKCLTLDNSVFQSPQKAPIDKVKALELIFTREQKIFQWKAETENERLKEFEIE